MDTQLVLGEIRAVRRELTEISLALRVDTFWTKVRDHIAHLMRSVALIPPAVRALLVAGVVVLGWGAIARNLKAVSVGVDLLMLSIMFVGGPDA
jgi:hypothetical protein